MVLPYIAAPWILWDNQWKIVEPVSTTRRRFDWQQLGQVATFDAFSNGAHGTTVRFNLQDHLRNPGTTTEDQTGVMRWEPQ